MEKFYIDGIAIYINRSEGAVRNLVMRRAIPYRKVAGRLIFLKEEIDAWIENAPGLSLEQLDKERNR